MTRFTDDGPMQRLLSLGLAAGVFALGAWAMVRRLRKRQTRRDLGTISDAWLHDPRSYNHDAD